MNKFKDSLQCPVLLSNTAESVMDVVEAVLTLGCDDDKKDINSMFGFIGCNGPIANAVVNTYKDRIIRLRTEVSKESFAMFFMLHSK